MPDASATKKAKTLDDLAWSRAWGGPLWVTRDKKAWLVDVYAALSSDGRYELEQTIHSLLVCEARELIRTGRLEPYGRYLALRAAMSKKFRAGLVRAERAKAMKRALGR